MGLKSATRHLALRLRQRWVWAVAAPGPRPAAPAGQPRRCAKASEAFAAGGAAVPALAFVASSAPFASKGAWAEEEEMFDFDDGLGGLGGGGLGGSGGGSGSRWGRNGPGGRGAARPKAKVPVSILTGFLGAGKTTLVQHILRNREGLKVGIVVNDVAEANIDSEVLKFGDADGIVGLQNGCACCSGRQDLFTRLEELVNSTGIAKLDKPWDRLVVECSGVAEPESIAKELEAMGRRGAPVMQHIFLAGIVCVVDASTFWDKYHATGMSEDTTRQPLAVLLVNQLESADTVIVNKADLVSEADMARLQQLLSMLAPNARRLISTQGALPLRDVMPAEAVAIDMPAYVPTLANRHGTAVHAAGRSAAAATAPVPEVDGHGHGHGHGHSHEGHSHDDAADCSVCAAQTAEARHARYGLSTFVYRRSDRLFDARRLAVAMRQLPVSTAILTFEAEAAAASPASPPQPAAVATAAAFQGVLRSKGFIRVRGNDKPLYWSHAGQQVQVTPADGVPTRGTMQEVVFIGCGVDERAVTEVLDACLEPDASL